jgi:hypothetical protein
MHTFFIIDLIKLQCLRHVSDIQVFIFRKTCTSSFVVYFMLKLHKNTFYYNFSVQNTTKLHILRTTAAGISGHFSTTLTEDFPCFFLSCTTNARYNTQRRGTARTSQIFFFLSLCMFCSVYCVYCLCVNVYCTAVLFVCKCVLYCCTVCV